jgi:DNA-binding response OmpR family regulator
MSPAPNGPRILIVDDEATLREVLRRYLEREGFQVSEAADGVTALQIALDERPDLVILDRMLPGREGTSVAQRLHEEGRIPVLMLTAKGSAEDRIEGLQAGADDYVVKPFNPREVVLRVRAILRRSQDAIAPREAPFEVGRFGLDPASRQVTVEGRQVRLTAKEFELLWTFARHPRQVFSRTQLLDRVWGAEFDGDASTVTVHIRRLREKIEPDPSHPRHLTTVWGVGYQFET